MENKDLLTSGCALAGVITITLFFVAIAALLIKLIAWALFVWRSEERRVGKECL